MDNEKIWPPAPTKKPLNRSSPKFAFVNTSGTHTPKQNFITIRLPFFALPKYAKIRIKLLRYVFVVRWGFFRQPTAKTPAPIFTIMRQINTYRWRRWHKMLSGFGRPMTFCTSMSVVVHQNFDTYLLWKTIFIFFIAKFNTVALFWFISSQCLNAHFFRNVTFFGTPIYLLVLVKLLDGLQVWMLSQLADTELISK